MRNRWAAAAFFALLVAVGLLLYWKHLNPKSSPYPVFAEKKEPALSQSKISNSISQQAASPDSTPDAAKENLSASQSSSGITASSPGEKTMSDVPPATVMENMRSAFRLYASTFGGNPVGTNPEITSALDGNNSKQIHFVQPDSGLRIDEQGELIDAWGTPFFFHQLSGTQMEIHSAGPDRKMWTSDDLVTK